MKVKLLNTRTLKKIKIKQAFIITYSNSKTQYSHYNDKFYFYLKLNNFVNIGNF